MEAFVQLLAAKQVNVAPFITHTFKVDEAPKAYDLITGKTGLANARIWTVTISNAGSGTATAAQIDGFSLTQTFGAACTPVITSPPSFPLGVGNIAPGGSAAGSLTLDCSSCAANARFRVDFTFSSDAGAASGSRTLYNQFR